jgi:hypothetical protein
MLHIIGGVPGHAARVKVDPYVPLRITWPAHPRPGDTVWWRFSRPGTMLETGFHGETGEVRDVTVVLPGPIARVARAAPTAAVRMPRVPCCEPLEWARRPLPAPLQLVAPNYLDDPEPLRTELGPNFLLLRIGTGEEPAARELVNGRVRFGISKDDLLLWICVDGFSSQEWALLEQHAAASLRPPASPETPPVPDAPWWRRVLGR